MHNGPVRIIQHLGDPVGGLRCVSFRLSKICSRSTFRATQTQLGVYHGVGVTQASA
jgi:hypothetical protein